MSKRRMMAAILAALMAWSGVAGAQTRFGDGNPLRSGSQATLQGGMLDADTTGRWDRHDNSGNKLTKEANPLNEKYATFLDIYYDTLSINGRSLDSTGTVYSCYNYGSVVLGAKMEGHHGAAGNAVRIGVTAIFSMTGLASDTTSSFAFGHTPAAFASDSTGSAALTAQILNGRNEQELVFLTHSAVSINTAAYRTGTLVWKNPGYPYVRFVFRVISDLGTAPTQGARFKLRASLGMRAL